MRRSSPLGEGLAAFVGDEARGAAPLSPEVKLGGAASIAGPFVFPAGSLTKRERMKERKEGGVFANIAPNQSMNYGIKRHGWSVRQL